MWLNRQLAAGRLQLHWKLIQRSRLEVTKHTRHSKPVLSSRNENQKKLFLFSFAVPSISNQLGTSCTKPQIESSRRWSHGRYVISRNVMNRPVVVHHAMSPNSCLACYFYANKIVQTSRELLKLISILIEFNELLCKRRVTRYDWGSFIYLLRQRSIWAIDMSVTCADV